MPSRLFADVSSNNARFDAAAYRSAGHRLIAIKATEGVSYNNPEYGPWVAAAHQHKLVVAHYHFARPGNDAITEARHFWGVVKSRFRKGDYLVLDLEVKHPGGDARTASWAGAFVAALRSLSGHTPILYTYASFLNEVGPSVVRRTPRVWIAQYAPAAQWPNWVSRRWAWQRTDGVNGPPPHGLPGVGKCDVSILNRRSFLRVLRYAR